jgi:hypothetical protein
MVGVQVMVGAGDGVAEAVIVGDGVLLGTALGVGDGMGLAVGDVQAWGRGAAKDGLGVMPGGDGVTSLRFEPRTTRPSRPLSHRHPMATAINQAALMRCPPSTRLTPLLP